MALIYIYDSTELDQIQISKVLDGTDHHWEYVSEKVSIENINPETEVLSVFITSQVTREIIEKLPKLRLISCRSTGFNNIDMQAAEEKGITVTNVPSYGESTVAEYAFTLLLALTRKLESVFAAENGNTSQQSLTGIDLCGKTLGVIGTGRIGQHSIKIGNGFSMRVLGYDAYPKEGMDEQLNFTYKSLDEVLAESDFITIHTPYLPSTHHLMNSENLAKMKKGAILVNTARGEIVDTNALIESLNSGHISGAALDVVEGEALLNHEEEVALLRSHEIAPELLKHSVEISILKKMPNVIISPHNAFNTYEAIERINTTSTQNIVDFWYGNVPNKVAAPVKEMGKLYLVRHGESEWNATGQWSGTSDVHLDDKGFDEATKFGLKFKENNFRIDIAYCSEQMRTRETIEGILNASQQFDVDVIHDSAINERDYGDYTGKNKWEMKELLGEDVFNELRRGWDVPVPNGETLKMVYERVMPFYTNVILPKLHEGNNVLIVGHGNCIRALMKYIDKITDEDIENLEMMFGQVVVYDVDEEGYKKDKLIITIDTTPPNA